MATQWSSLSPKETLIPSVFIEKPWGTLYPDNLPKIKDFPLFLLPKTQIIIAGFFLLFSYFSIPFGYFIFQPSLFKDRIELIPIIIS